MINCIVSFSITNLVNPLHGISKLQLATLFQSTEKCVVFSNLIKFDTSPWTVVFIFTLCCTDSIRTAEYSGMRDFGRFYVI